MVQTVSPAMLAEPFDMSGRTFTPPAGSVGAAALAAGLVLQTVYQQTGALATGTIVLPFDDTIPQSSEGNEYLTATIVPLYASSVLQVDVSIVLASSFAGTTAMSAALFRDSGASALAAGTMLSPSANSPMTISFRHRVSAGSTVATTFRVRGGSSGAGTTTFNGNAGARGFGGVMASSITITEIKA